jgi:heat shock 70kDa protein 4
MERTAARVQVYEAKLAELKAKGDPIKLRYIESATRDSTFQTLSNACQHNLQWCTTEEPKYAHITAAEREVVSKESTSALAWLEEKMKAQGPLTKMDAPAVLTKEISDRKSTLDAVCNPVLNKAVPPPPKPEKKAEPKVEGPTEGTGEAPMQEDAVPPAPSAEAAVQSADPMEEP